MEPRTKQLHLRIPWVVLQQLREIAHKRNESITALVLRALYKLIREESKY